MNKEGSYGGLDRFRLIAAALVAAIHTSPLLSFNETADFFLTRILGRIGVPFFFMVTGQFILSEALIGKRKQWGKVGKYLKKTGMLYMAAILIYVPVGMYAGHYKELSAADIFRMLVFDGTFYHLWYFPASMTGVLLVYLMSRLMGKRKVLAVSGALYMIGLFGDSYYGLVSRIPVAASVYELGFSVFSYTRNGLFLAPVFLVLGGMADNWEFLENKSRVLIYGGLLFSFSVMTAEAFTLRCFGIQRHDSMYLGLVPVMICLYGLLLSWKKQPLKKIRTVAAWIYILHPAVIAVVRGMAKALHLTAVLVDNSLIHYFAVFFLSLLAAVVLSLLPEYFRTGRGNKKFAKGRAWIELDREALRKNVDYLRAKLPESCGLMPAVKANAYGHGAVLTAKELNRMGVKAFCAACVREGAELRRQGIKGEILILGYTHPGEFYLLVKYRLTQTVIDFSYGTCLNRYGRKIHRKIPVHVGIDTGMHRLGERSENIDRIAGIFSMEHLKIDGIFTHLCADDVQKEPERTFTHNQIRAFYQVLEALGERGWNCPKIHLQSSYGVINYPEAEGDYARVGIALYGVLSLKEDVEKMGGFLTPVLSLKARVALVKNLYEGESAGYGLHFRTDRDRKIAVLAVGYGDGIPRSLSEQGGEVLINGYRVPIIGRICMDQMMVDVSTVPEVKAGDEAVLIGRSGEEEISACDLAERAGTIANEILSRLGARLERIVL